MSKIPGDVWTQHVLNALRDVGAELQGATKEIDDEILRKGQKDTEVRRFNDLIFLLDECLNYIQQHLRTYDKIKSRLGVDELGSIANDTDIVCCMRSDVHLRREYLASREAKDPRFICFMKMAELTVKRLRDRGRSLPLDKALRVMLKVIPKLDALTLETLPFQDWYELLLGHGMTIEAEDFRTAMINHPTLHSGASTPKGKHSDSAEGSAYMPSASVAGSTYLLPTRDFTPRRAPVAESVVEDDDEDRSSTSGSTLRDNINGAPVPSVEPTPKKSTFLPKMPARYPAPWKGTFDGPGRSTDEQRPENSAQGQTRQNMSGKAFSSNMTDPQTSTGRKKPATQTAADGNKADIKDAIGQNALGRSADEEVQDVTSPLTNSTPQRRRHNGVYKPAVEQNIAESDGGIDTAAENENTSKAS